MFATILSVAAVVMAAAALILHKVAPMTKNTYDDKVAEIVDKVLAALPKA